jgi:hypothetical protein
MPAPRFRYSPSTRPRSITTRVEHPTTHRRTGDVCTYTPVLALHPRPPIKCPHYKSDTARMLDRGRSRREWSTHNAPPHRRRLHVHAGTGHPPINCLHHDSDTARMLDRGRSRREWSTPHRTAAQETPARTGRYWPCLHPRPPYIACITIQIQPECSSATIHVAMRA